MKLTKGDIKKHVKIFSEELNLSSNNNNNFITKLLNQKKKKKIDTDSIDNENFGNFKLNIQNIFANDDKKKKAIQYVIQIRRDRNKSPFLQKGNYNTINKDIHLSNNKSQINMSTLNKTLDNNFYDLYNENNLSRNQVKKNDYNIRKTNEIIPKENNNNNNNIKSNLFAENKNIQNLKYNNISSNNNLLRNFQNYGLYNKNEKNYNMTKLKNKILDNNYIPDQDIRYSKTIYKEQNPNQAMYNTQINFNYNTNKKYYVHKNLVYSKKNKPINRTTTNELNSKPLLIQNKSKQRKNPINNSFINNNNNLINNNINIEKIFNHKKLVKIKAVYFSIYQVKNKSNRKNEIFYKSLIKFNKDKLIPSKNNEFKLINNNKKKFEFNFKNETEMFNYIKNKYDNKKIKEMLNFNINEEKFNKMKEENNNFKIEIENLKDENEQYKIELNDIRNQFNDLNKELKITKEENEKLKDNFINNMIEEDNNPINDNE